MVRYILALGITLVGTQFVAIPAYAQESVKCESKNFRYRECDAYLRRPRIARQISKAPCIAGDSWGYQRGAIWVDKGCAAIFADARGGDRPQWRDRDRDRYDRDPRRRYDDGMDTDY